MIDMPSFVIRKPLSPENINTIDSKNVAKNNSRSLGKENFTDHGHVPLTPNNSTKSFIKSAAEYENNPFLVESTISSPITPAKSFSSVFNSGKKKKIISLNGRNTNNVNSSIVRIEELGEEPKMAPSDLINLTPLITVKKVVNSTGSTPKPFQAIKRPDIVQAVRNYTKKKTVGGDSLFTSISHVPNRQKPSRAKKLTRALSLNSEPNYPSESLELCDNLNFGSDLGFCMNNNDLDYLHSSNEIEELLSENIEFCQKMQEPFSMPELNFFENSIADSFHDLPSESIDNLLSNIQSEPIEWDSVSNHFPQSIMNSVNQMIGQSNHLHSNLNGTKSKPTGFDTILEEDEAVLVEKQTYNEFLDHLRQDLLYESEDSSDEVFSANDVDDESEREEFRNDMAVRVTYNEILNLLEGDEIDSSSKYFKRNTHERELKLKRIKESLCKRLAEPFYPFKEEQLSEIKRQMADLFQIFIQQIGLSIEIQNAHEYGLFALDSLAEIRCYLDSVKDKIPNSSNIPEEFRKSFFDTPGIHQISPLTILATGESRRKNYAKPKLAFEEVVESIPIVFTSSFVQLVDFLPSMPSNFLVFIQPYLQYFNPKNIPLLSDSLSKTKCSNLKVKFLPCEDQYILPLTLRLLLAGLKKYGTCWEVIQRCVLPTKHSKQIHFRYKNQISRRTPDNPIKAFYFNQLKPLSPEEEEVLYLAVQRFGRNFDEISRRYFPNRPATVLKKIWTALDNARKSSDVETDCNIFSTDQEAQ